MIHRKKNDLLHKDTAHLCHGLRHCAFICSRKWVWNKFKIPQGFCLLSKVSSGGERKRRKIRKEKAKNKKEPPPLPPPPPKKGGGIFSRHWLMGTKKKKDCFTKRPHTCTVGPLGWCWKYFYRRVKQSVLRSKIRVKLKQVLNGGGECLDCIKPYIFHHLFHYDWPESTNLIQSVIYWGVQHACEQSFILHEIFSLSIIIIITIIALISNRLAVL